MLDVKLHSSSLHKNEWNREFKSTLMFSIKFKEYKGSTYLSGNTALVTHESTSQTSHALGFQKKFMTN